jgi:cell pole-organizing protein PopZ
MEEILASIRRIIADEEPGESAAHGGAAFEAPPPRMAASPPEPQANEAEVDSMLARLQGGPRQAPSEERRGASPPDEGGLISAETTEAVDAAFGTLTEAVQVRNGRTVEELVSELIRPMLKTWLDDNLPDMVERLVRAEIERVSRRRSE